MDTVTIEPKSTTGNIVRPFDLSSTSNYLAEGIFIALGTFLVYTFHFSIPPGNEGSAFLLGILFLGFGIAPIMMKSKQDFFIETNKRSFTTSRSSILGTKMREIFFADVISFHAAPITSGRSGTPAYSVIAKLRSGEEIVVPTSGAIESFSYITINGNAEKLSRYLSGEF